MLALVVCFFVIDNFFEQAVSLTIYVLVLSFLKEVDRIRNLLTKTMFHFCMNEYYCYKAWSSEICSDIKPSMLIIDSSF